MLVKILRNVLFLILLPLSIFAKESCSDVLSEYTEKLYENLEETPEISLLYADSILQIVEDPRKRANALYVKGYLHEQRSEPTKALLHYLNSDRILKALSNEKAKRLRCKVLINLGNILQDHYKFEEANEFYSKVIDLSKETSFAEMEIKSYHNIAESYLYMKSYTESEEFSRKCLELAKGSSSEMMIVKSLNNLGIVNKRLGQYSMALQHYRSMMGFEFEKIDADLFMGMAAHNISNIYFELNSLDSSEIFLHRALQLKFNSNTPASSFITLLDLSSLYLQTNRNEEALEVALQAEEIYDQVPLNKENIELFDIMSQINFALKRYDEAERCVNRFRSETQKFIAQQEEIIKFREQFKMDLILAGFYQETSAEEEISILQTLIWILTGLILLGSIAVPVRKAWVKTSIARAIRRIEHESIV